MFEKILCKLGFHKFKIDDEWIPSFDAPVIRKCILSYKCNRCGRGGTEIFNFDEEGRPIV